MARREPCSGSHARSSSGSRLALCTGWRGVKKSGWVICWWGGVICCAATASCGVAVWAPGNHMQKTASRRRTLPRSPRCPRSRSGWRKMGWDDASFWELSDAQVVQGFGKRPDLHRWAEARGVEGTVSDSWGRRNGWHQNNGSWHGVSGLGGILMPPAAEMMWGTAKVQVLCRWCAAGEGTCRVPLFVAANGNWNWDAASWNVLAVAVAHCVIPRRSAVVTSHRPHHHHPL